MKKVNFFMTLSEFSWFGNFLCWTIWVRMLKIMTSLGEKQDRGGINKSPSKLNLDSRNVMGFEK